jgi:hypothetical protein
MDGDEIVNGRAAAAATISASVSDILPNASVEEIRSLVDRGDRSAHIPPAAAHQPKP